MCLIQTLQSKLVLLPALVLLGGLCHAQTTGYIAGAKSLTSFDSSTGAIINAFSNGGDDTQFAVAGDDSTLYIPTNSLTSGTGTLNVVSGASGQLLNSVALPLGATKAILSSGGSTLYVLCPQSNRGFIYVIDVATLSITGTITFPEGTSPFDIALSPRSTTLYVAVEGSVNKGEGCYLQGICVFDAVTLALTGHVERLFGYLGVSNDGNSLYVGNSIPGNPGRVRVVDTSTLAISAVPVNNPIFNGPIISPLGHWAVLAGETQTPSAMAYLVNTSTNKPVAEFLSSFPGNAGPAAVGDEVDGSAAFAPDGKSVWMLLSCVGFISPPSCSTVDNAAVELVGFLFPSGEVISTTPVSSDAGTIAFPR